MLLGPMAEKQLRNALSISQGNWSVFVEQPLLAMILAISAVVLLVPIYLRNRGIHLHGDD
jgi:putative tricarboxylic transport membrane protein